MKIIGIAGSNSSNSINEMLVKYALGLIKGAEIDYVDLKKLDAPIFGVDLEATSGIPGSIIELHSRLKEVDGLIISVAEHNGNLTVHFKNILDWLSRYDGKHFNGKKVLLLGTSPGKGGAQKAMAMMERPIKYGGAELTDQFSFPSFGENSETNPEFRITNKNLLKNLNESISKLLQSLN